MTVTVAEVRARLVVLESLRLVAGRQHKAEGKPCRVFVIMGEGRRKAGISDARSTAA